MASSTRYPASRFVARPAAVPSRFDYHAGSGGSYGYWASGPQVAPGRGRRSKPLASDVYPPVGKAPSYYAAPCQIMLWLACLALAVLTIFG